MKMSIFTPANYRYLSEKLKIYESSPDSLEEDWLALFQGMEFGILHGSFEGGFSKELIVSELIRKYRNFGHLKANLRRNVYRNIDFGEFSDQELRDSYPSMGILKGDAPLSTIIDRLSHIYSGNIGFEFPEDPEVQEWLERRVIEGNGFNNKKFLLEELFKAKYLERFLNIKFLGEKRFSLEGAEVFLPMVKEICRLASNDYDDLVIGMAHRGRINIMGNLMGQPYEDIFKHFAHNVLYEGAFGGDVKYHMGYKTNLLFGDSNIRITLPSNPSHLESINPVAIGMTKALQVSGSKAFPLLVHGDAALSAQGVVYETMQLSGIEGYSVGGAIHIVINNGLGFTANESEGRSTTYCTDIAKSFGAPVIHVNSEFPVDCMWGAILAFDLSKKFNIEVFLDLQCSRLWGHNEGDEPRFTNPKAYKYIDNMKDAYSSYLAEVSVDEKWVSQMEDSYKKKLSSALNGSSKEEVIKLPPYKGYQGSLSLSMEKLIEIGSSLTKIPSGFNIHPKIRKFLDKRSEIFRHPEDKLLDWASAEVLAFACLLLEGIDVRLSGQDSIRGTFSQRHAGIFDQDNEDLYIPLNHVNSKGIFTPLNSPLSELAVMGFEFGYTLSCNDSLVIWEAQFGDFSNCAQVIIDEYIASGRSKWGINSSLTLFLPHGYEGMGPDHSSSRLERFLQLSADNNWVVACPSNPAQLFHLLIRQGISKGESRIPLVVATPKSILRLRESFSSLKDLTDDNFHTLLVDQVKDCQRLILCSGKIYYDLLKQKGDHRVSIVRIEELYPLDISTIKNLDGDSEIYWVQEECANQGAWPYLRKFLEPLNVKYIGRDYRSSPDSGSFKRYLSENKAIVSNAYKGLS